MGFSFLAGNRVLVAGSRLEVVQADETARHGAAYQAPDNKPEGRTGHGQFHYPGDILHIGKSGGVCGPGAMSTGQGYGAAQQSHQGMQVHAHGGHQAQAILQDEIDDTDRAEQ